jgi:glutaminase
MAPGSPAPQPKSVPPKSVPLSDLYRLFLAFSPTGEPYTTKGDILTILSQNGIHKKDARIQDLIEALEGYTAKEPIDFETFQSLAAHHVYLLQRAAQGGFVIPDFSAFTQSLTQIYQDILPMETGDVARYIPQLARVDPKYLGISVCTVDGQTFDIGDTDVGFCVQSTCKPITYCIALEKVGEDKVHAHVGREPSGQNFNAITLNSKNLPHNPMINAGSMVCASLIHPNQPLADRFDAILSVWQRLCGGVRPGFNSSVYHSEKETADRNFALAYFMKEVGAFPKGTDIHQTLDLYFQCCSIEVTTKNMATLAATFANAGVCPMTGDRVLSPSSVKHGLSLMLSCGMYNFSGEFAFSVGLPAKSGISGVIMLVIPGVMGITVWSPRLDALGNSVRGVAFCEKLVSLYNFHNFDGAGQTSGKKDPRLPRHQESRHLALSLILASSQGDLDEVKRLIARGASHQASDYDGRTPLHLAAAEGRQEVATYLCHLGAETGVLDRFGRTPQDEAASSGITL